jgi:polysaccharide export outer membrane protein
MLASRSASCGSGCSEGLGSGRRTFIAALLGASVSWACGPRTDNSRARLPAPVESTTLGPGDVFVLEIVGEKELPHEYQVASDGTVDVPYVQQLKVEGLEPQQVAALVREQLIERKILTQPSVTVRVLEYNSKRVTILGQVQKPGSFPLSPGMTLVQAVSVAGGFNAIANRDRINITRRTQGGTKTVVVSFDAINEGSAPDIPLQAGDQIYVHERLF